MPYQKLEYKKFRVKTPVRSFRDLEVYRKPTALSAEISQIKLPRQFHQYKKELEILHQLSKIVPKLVAESYGDKFVSLEKALEKLEQAMQIISNIITKIDYLVACLDNHDLRENLNSILKKYQTQRIKILNLKRAWHRVWQEK